MIFFHSKNIDQTEEKMTTNQNIKWGSLYFTTLKL